MSGRRHLIDENVEQSLKTHQHKSLLRLIACGNIGDGKNTLIGRLLYESKPLLEAPLSAQQQDSKMYGAQGDELDFALLVDSLSAEREQGVAYHFFSAGKRKFIVAAPPGHEQYTRSMIADASTADVAVILVDARKGMQTQTRLHSYLVSLIGIRQLVLVINKLDMVGYSQEVFEQLDADYRIFASKLGIEPSQSIPLSALHGDNVTESSPNTPWYQGPSLMQFLETVAPDQPREDVTLRMPVQWVHRPALDVHGLPERILGGSVRPGDINHKTSEEERLLTLNGDLRQAATDQSVPLTLSDQIGISRGDVIATVDAPPAAADQFEATVVWLSDEAMLPGRQYLIKLGAGSIGGTLGQPRYQIDVNNLDHLPTKTLKLNEIGVCTLNLDRAAPFAPCTDNRDGGSFIIMDRYSHQTIGAGMLHFALRRSQNIHWQALEVDKAARTRLNGHKPCVIWLTGLSGAGKSTIANLLEHRLHALGVHTYVLDGDNVRHGLNKDLGFTAADRVENIRRIGEVAKLMVDAGLMVVTAFISPFRSERQLARDLVAAGEFIEVFVDTPLEEVEKRDPKGLYKKARRGELKNFTGIDSPYETPEQPEIRIETLKYSAEEAADRVVRHLREIGLLA